MDPDGPNLRRLYLPGLEALKLKLAAFESLMSRHLPLLHRHLAAAAVPSVLYASQWIMTSFACPFPPPFAARVIDVLLQVRPAALPPSRRLGWPGLAWRCVRGGEGPGPGRAGRVVRPRAAPRSAAPSHAP
jgi:hypothetical protein